MRCAINMKIIKYTLLFLQLKWRGKNESGGGGGGKAGAG